MKKALITIEFTLLGLTPFIVCYPFAAIWQKQAPVFLVIGLQIFVHYLWGKYVSRKLDLTTNGITAFVTTIGTIVPLTFFISNYDSAPSIDRMMYGYVLTQLFANFMVSFYIIHKIGKEKRN